MNKVFNTKWLIRAFELFFLLFFTWVFILVNKTYIMDKQIYPYILLIPFIGVFFLIYHLIDHHLEENGKKIKGEAAYLLGNKFILELFFNHNLMSTPVFIHVRPERHSFKVIHIHTIVFTHSLSLPHI